MELIELRKELEEINKKITEFKTSLKIEDKTERVAEIENMMLEADFWNDSEAASLLVTESKSIKKELDEFSEMIDYLEHSEEMVEFLKDEDDEEMKEDEISNMELAGPNSNEIVHKTLNFLTNFARFKNRSSCETVEKLLNDFSEHCNEPLHPFELAQLGTLECEDPEEAKSLIPSLQNKVSDVQLQTLLTELRKYQTLS